MKKVAIFALAAVAALSACKKGDDAGNGDSTAVITDTTATAPAAMPAPATTDTTMAAPPAAPMGTDSMGGMTDTTKMDTTKKM
jgi:hypothetical protein